MYEQLETSVGYLKEHLLQTIKDYREKHIAIKEDTKFFIEGVQMLIIEERSAHEMVETLKELLDKQIPKSFWQWTSERAAFAQALLPIIAPVDLQPLLKLDLLRQQKAEQDKQMHIKSLENALEILADQQDQKNSSLEEPESAQQQAQQIETLYTQNIVLLEKLTALSQANDALQKANEDLAQNNGQLTQSLTSQKTAFSALKQDLGLIKEQARQQANLQFEIKTLRQQLTDNERQIQTYQQKLAHFTNEKASYPTAKNSPALFRGETKLTAKPPVAPEDISLNYGHRN